MPEWICTTFFVQQVRKPRSYASLKLRPNQRLTSLKCRATSIAKNVSLFCTYYVVCFDELMGVFYCTTCCGGRMSWPWRGCCDSLHFGHTSFASKKGFQHRMRRFWGGHFRMSFKGLSTSFRLKPLLGIKIFSGLQFIKHILKSVVRHSLNQEQKWKWFVFVWSKSKVHYNDDEVKVLLKTTNSMQRWPWHSLAACVWNWKPHNANPTLGSN